MSAFVRGVFTVLTCFCFAACNRGAEVGLNPGDLAPDFSLQDLAGSQRKLSDQRNKIVILNFFASWCSTCIEEMPSLQRLYSKLGSDCLAVVAVAVDDEESKLRPFIRDLSLTFPILLDQTGRIRAKYKVDGYPETFVIDLDGKVKMFFDYEKGEPVARILGPRNWERPEIENQLISLCNLRKGGFNK